MNDKIDLYQKFKDENIHRLIINSPYKSKTVTSYGIIVYSSSTKRSLLVKRKHTVQFLILINGCYRESYLYDYIPKITNNEAKKLRKCFLSKRYFKYLFKYTGNNVFFFEYSFKKFYLNLNLIKTIYNNTSFTNVKLEWNWPKGKPNSNRENFFECAKREFSEELECELPEALAISNEWVRDSFIAIGGRVIESKYIIYIVEDEFAVKKPDKHSEVSDRKWFTFEELKNKGQINSFLLDRIVSMISNN